MTLDPQAAQLCERIRRAGGGGFAGRSVAEIRRAGLALSGTWSLDDTCLGIMAHLSRSDGSSAESIAGALGLPLDTVDRTLDDLRRSGFVRARELDGGGRRWSALISGRRRHGGAASGALLDLLAPEPQSNPPGHHHDRALAGGVAVRVYRPATSETVPLVFFVHGGAWVSGTLDAYDNICESVVELVGCVVMSVEYRLVPEHAFPAQVDDVLAALRWAVEHAAEFGADAERLAVMGDSAGGNLTTVAARTAVLEGWCNPVLQVLLYPVLDAAMTSPSVAEHADAPLFNRADLEWMYEQYRAPAGDWRASPLGAPDLNGSPPALIVVAGVDPVRDDGLRYAERLAASGIPVATEVFPSMMHGFFALAPALTEAARARELVAQALARSFGVER